MKAATIGHDRNIGVSLLEHAADLPNLYRHHFGAEATISTGFPTLDWCLKGGFKRGGLYSSFYKMQFKEESGMDNGSVKS